MGAYFGMDLNAMASMLYGQRAEPWHAGADIWGSASQQLLSTNGDLGAANAVLKTWQQSVNSVSHAAFSRGVIDSQASLVEWAAYTGSMSAALRLGGTALHAAQAVMPALQSGYDTAIALSSAPIIGPIAAQAAVAIQTVGAGMMEAVGGVMQAPTAVPPPAKGWQGPGNGNGAPPAPSPVPAVSPVTVLDAADKLMGVLDKGATLAQNVMSLARSGSTEGLGDLGKLEGMDRPEIPGLAGEHATGAPSLAGASANQPAGANSPGALAGGGAVGAVGALGAAGLLRGAGGGAGQLANGVLGARIGSEPALAGGAARTAAAAGAGRPPAAIAPPLPGGGGGGGGDVRQGGRPGSSARTDEQEERLRRNGVRDGLQGRAARESTERFGLAPARRRRRAGNADAVLDEELFDAVPDTARLDRPSPDQPRSDRPHPDQPSRDQSHHGRP